MKRILLVIILFWPLLQPVLAQSLAPFEAQSAVTRPYIIELYTSQGCSSCPPAEAWLAEQFNKTDLWQKYFPLAFHVTYWDYLGWKDIFGQRAFSERQYQHLNQKHTRQVYTPQFVINAKESRGWFSGELSGLFTEAQPEVGVLKVRIANQQLEASFVPQPIWAQDKDLHRARLHLALVGSGFTTEIKRGENRHKQLPHDFVVLSLQSLPASTVLTGVTDPALQFTQSLDAIPASALNAPRLAWVAWLTLNEEPIQAVGGWLEAPQGEIQSQ
ncbi:MULTISPECIES: DUF1223 domain-containing protein [Shewanella]|uniref:DUF1223 domain-containing protein n=1 Tax=Shewanella TaxID=22 RepID=UPI00201AD606|nr:DUF1223 domain-containing protein [Shewanella sp. 10B]